MRTFRKAILILAALALAACGRIETGSVGVRTDFNKTIEQTALNPGWYGAVLTSVDEYVVKETELKLDNLRPKAKDNLSLNDLDMSIFYTVNGAKVPALVTKYKGMSPKGDGGYYPGFGLVDRLARGAIYDSVAQFDSLTMHTKRSELEKSIHEALQKELDKNDTGVFQITKVVVRSLVTDPALEQSIQQAVRVQKQIEAKQNEIKLAQAEAERKRVEAEGQARSNRILAESVTDQFIRYEQVKALREFAGQGTHTVLLPQDARPLVNVGK